MPCSYLGVNKITVLNFSFLQTLYSKNSLLLILKKFSSYGPSTELIPVNCNYSIIAKKKSKNYWQQRFPTKKILENWVTKKIFSSNFTFFNTHDSFCKFFQILLSGAGEQTDYQKSLNYHWGWFFVISNNK